MGKLLVTFERLTKFLTFFKDVSVVSWYWGRVRSPNDA